MNYLINTTILLLLSIISFGQTKEVSVLVNNEETSTIKFGKEIQNKKWMSCQTMDKPFEIDISQKELNITANGNAGPCKLRITFEDDSKMDIIIHSTDKNTPSTIDLKTDKKISAYIEDHKENEPIAKANEEIKKINVKEDEEDAQPQKTSSQLKKEKLAIKPEQLTKQVNTLLGNFYAYCTNIGNHKVNFETAKKQVKADIFGNNDESNIQTINSGKPPKNYTVDEYLTRLNIQKPYKKVSFEVKNISILSEITRDPSTGQYTCVVSYQQVYTVSGGNKETGKFAYKDITTKIATLTIDVRTVTDPNTGDIYDTFKAFIKDITAKSVES